MDPTSLSMPVAALIASIIGATATITAALIQLTIAWRKEMKSRAGREPIDKRTRRGVLWAVFALMVASAVGGFALSQYLVSEARKETQAREAEFNARLERLGAIADRLERVVQGSNPAVAEATPAQPSQEAAVTAAPWSKQATATPVPSSKEATAMPAPVPAPCMIGNDLGQSRPCVEPLPVAAAGTPAPASTATPAPTPPVQ